MIKPLAYSYIRMSSALQLKGDSLRRQTELSRKYADENDLELVQDFKLSDIAMSAFKGENAINGALGKFLEAVDSGEIPKGSYLLVESLDRLSRQKISQAMNLFNNITQSGINIATLSDGQLYKAGSDDLAQFMYSIIIMSRANEESETKSRRISAAWSNKRANINDRILTRLCPAWLKVSADRSEFNLLPDRAETILRIFEAAASGQGSNMITRNLNSKKVPHFGKSNGWIESYVTKILQNRAVLGEFQPHHKVDQKRVPVGDVIKNYFPQIIDEDLFLKVQADRRKRKVGFGGRRGTKQNNLFTHIIKCAYCNEPMHFVDKGKGPKGGTYIKCSSVIRGLDCPAKTWKYVDFEVSFFSFVREIDLNEVIERSSNRTKKAILREELTIEQERVIQLNSNRDRIFNLFLDGDNEDDYIKEKLNDIKLELISTEEKIRHVKEELEAFNSIKDYKGQDVLDQIATIRQFEQSDNVEKRVLVSSKLKEFVKEIRIAADGSKPNYERALSSDESTPDGIEGFDEIRDVLKETYLTGILSNPYFVIIFYDGTERLVIPSADNPTKLLQQTDYRDKTYIIEDGSGNVSRSRGILD